MSVQFFETRAGRQFFEVTLPKLKVSWRGRYLSQMERLLAEFRRRAAVKSQAASSQISAAIDPLLPSARASESLSRKALWVLASTPGVSTVLVGMRSARYVDDAMGMLHWPALDEVERVYRAVESLRPR